MRKIALYIGATFVLLGNIVFSAAGVQAKTTNFTREEVYMLPKEDCKKFDICDLERIIFRTHDRLLKRENAEDFDLYWTKMYASYVTSTLAGIEKYAFVQFIRGCIFTSEMLPNGKVETSFDVVRAHIDVPEGKMLFRHPDWVIDSNDDDPVYSSDSSYSDNRHFFYQWNVPPGAWDPNLSQGKLYGEERLPFPQLYVTDLPASAVLFSDGRAQNSSLEFRACLYKTADIPKKAKGGDVNFAAPIKCFEWAQSYVFNHQTRLWERPLGVVAECRRPLTEEEVAIAKTLSQWLKYRP